MTFCCFDLYFENEKCMYYEFHLFFTPYDPRKNLICSITKLNHFDYFNKWTLTPLQLILEGVHPKKKKKIYNI